MITGQLSIVGSGAVGGASSGGIGNSGGGNGVANPTALSSFSGIITGSLASALPAIATTGVASVVTATSASLNGTINDDGAATTASFEYGPTIVYGSSVSASPGTVAAGAGITSVTAAISTLACSTTYHFRVKGVSSVGTVKGADATFTTGLCSQSVTFGTAPSLIVGGTASVSATASSGLAVAYSTTSATCSVNASSGLVTAIAAGTCTIVASQAGNSVYVAAQNSQDVIVGKANQAITFTSTAPTSPTIGGPGYTVTAVGGGSGNAVVFSLDATSTANTCSVSGGVVNFVGTGTCIVDANQAGSANYNAAPQVTQSITVSPPTRLANISTRGQVQTGFDVMIGGFVISGASAKTVVVRAIGPSLANFGVSGALPNPTLQLVRSSDQSVIATNDDWGSAANAAQITSSGFAPSNPLESAILTTLQPGAYTAIVSGVGGATGVGLVEVYEVDHPEIALINISTRGKVQTGFDVMIGGFVIQGSGPETVVIRAIGPSLANYGISGPLANPTMSLVRMSDQATIATNDDWGSASNAAQISSSGFAPSNALESAILITLQPGAYTAVVSGVGGGIGVGLVEVYKVGP